MPRPTTSWNDPSERRDQGPYFIERVGLCQAVLRDHVHPEELATRARRHPGGTTDEDLVFRLAGDPDEDPLHRLPRTLDPAGLHVVAERLLHPVGHPEQGELAQRTQVPLAEVVGQGRVDLLGWVDVPVRHAAAQGVRRHVHELLLVGAPHDLIRHGLPLADAGDPLHHVVHRFEVLDVDRGDHVDAGVQELVDVLPPLLVARAGDVRVRELVDERHLGRARDDRVHVHLLEGRLHGR